MSIARRIAALEVVARPPAPAVQLWEGRTDSDLVVNCRPGQVVRRDDLPTIPARLHRTYLMGSRIESRVTLDGQPWPVEGL